MAKFSIIASYSNGFEWEISELQTTWDSNGYTLAVLRNTPYVSGSLFNFNNPPPGNAYAYNVSAGYQLNYPSTNQTPVYGVHSFRCWTLSTSAITVYPCVVDASGQYWGVTAGGTVPSGSYVPGIQWSPSANRPQMFYWTYSKIQNGNFNLTANEWNGLTANINAVRAYKGIQLHSFTTAYQGNKFTAVMYNEAVDAINDIAGYGAYLNTVNAGDNVTADCMNILVSELNIVP